MNSFSVRELKSTDVEALLAFEINNRAWFESHIDARDPSFYSLQGVTEHIQSFLSDFAVGAWHPFVIEDDKGEIVGRANLKDIDLVQKTAQVGYRIDQRVCGQGLATQALKHLIQVAQGRWNLTQLVAYVFAQNAGSKKVLDRCGFLLVKPSGHGEAEAECRYVLSLL